MEELRRYIKSTFNIGIDVDAKQYSKNGRLKLLTKEKYYIYPTPIPYTHLKKKQDEYVEHIVKAARVWSLVLNNLITFEVVDSPYRADIKVYWAKANLRYAGMQYFENNLNHKTYCVSIGLMGMRNNEYTSHEVYKIILHEFGHILGLGHSPNLDDVMAADWEHSDKPSKNDIIVLNLIYSLGARTYSECEDLIEKFLFQYANQNSNITNPQRNLSNEIQNIGYINKNKLAMQNIGIRCF